jgi:hypothetical protein
MSEPLTQEGVSAEARAAESNLFMVTGGGSAAKVAEAWIHLCAAGLGPDNLHLLLIDSETSNGNVVRAIDTIRAYAPLEKWPWTVARTEETNESPEKNPDSYVNLFKTRVHLYALLEAPDSIKAAGLDGALKMDQELGQVMRMLYDEAERGDRHQNDGFRARPNVGCLLLEDHLTKHLENPADTPDSPGISMFVDALNIALTTSASVPVLVVGSIFGGTGASLIPIARTCIEAAIRRRQNEPGLAKIQWGRLMLLPYFKPKDKIFAASSAEEKLDPSKPPAHKYVYIDPDRFLLDTSSALQFYGNLQNRRAADASRENEITYIVGANDPARNVTNPSIGSMAQTNPAYVEELVAALAVYHFTRLDFRESRKGPVHVFVPRLHDRTFELTHLPGGADVRRQLAYLLHLASFFLRVGNSEKGECTTGLWRYLQFERNKRGADNKRHEWDFSELSRSGWYDAMLNKWIDQIGKSREAEPLANAGPNPGARIRVLIEHEDKDKTKEKYMMRQAARDASWYFGRLLLWAGTVLQGGDTAILEFDHTDSRDYISLHNGLCQVTAKHIERDHRKRVPYKSVDDNALVRLLRGAVVVMAREQHKEVFHFRRKFQPIDSDGKKERIGIAVGASDLRGGLVQIIKEAEVDYCMQSYGWKKDGPIVNAKTAAANSKS